MQFWVLLAAMAGTEPMARQAANSSCATPCHSSLLAQVLALAGSDNYLHRMTVLSAIGALAGCVSKDVVHNSMLPAVVACSKVGGKWVAWTGDLQQGKVCAGSAALCA